LIRRRENILSIQEGSQVSWKNIFMNVVVQIHKPKVKISYVISLPYEYMIKLFELQIKVIYAVEYGCIAIRNLGPCRYIYIFLNWKTWRKNYPKESS
jgi:hypothetical protein